MARRPSGEEEPAWVVWALRALWGAWLPWVGEAACLEEHPVVVEAALLPSVPSGACQRGAVGREGVPYPWEELPLGA